MHLDNESVAYISTPTAGLTLNVPFELDLTNQHDLKTFEDAGVELLLISDISFANKDYDGNDQYLFVTMSLDEVDHYFIFNHQSRQENHIDMTVWVGTIRCLFDTAAAEGYLVKSLSIGSFEYFAIPD